MIVPSPPEEALIHYASIILRIIGMQENKELFQNNGQIIMTITAHHQQKQKLHS